MAAVLGSPEYEPLTRGTERVTLEVRFSRRTASSRSVTGVVEAQSKGKKIRVFKMKRRKQYRKTIGHRSLQTRVRVKAIQVGHGS
jgi:ribosomal protein L21